MVLATETEDHQRAIDVEIAKHQADIEKYQAIIEKHQTAIVALNVQRNRFAFISRLPPEILSRIFELLKAAYYPYNSLEWIKATNVTTYWREVAMDSPTLWDDPPLGNPEWQQEMLERSKTTSLTIKTDVSYGPVYIKKTGLLDILLYHGSRIKHLVITGVDLECLKILKNLPVSTPCLETLFLHASKSLRSRSDVCTPNRTLTHSKNLRRLQIHRLPGLDFFCWDLFSLSNITHLELNDTAEGASLTWRRFMGALKQMTKLEQLDLSNFIDPTIEDDTLSLGLVSLRCLKRLDMNCSTGPLEIFFRHTAFAPSATVDVVAASPFDSPSFTNTISNIARLYSDISPELEFRSLSVRENDSGSSFALYRKIIGNFNDTMDCPVLSLYFDTSDFFPTASIMSALFDGQFSLDKVTHARIYTCSVSADTLAYTIGTFPALSLITVEDAAAAPFLKALCLRRNAPDTPPFANLVSIRLRYVEFKGVEEETPEDVLDLELLKDCLKQRQECGAKIQNLVLEDCFNLKDSDLLELQAIVADVDWDKNKDCWNDDNVATDTEEAESS